MDRYIVEKRPRTSLEDLDRPLNMYLMYVDETGDTGITGSPTSHFGLSGLVIHESRWREFVNQMNTFRKTMRVAHGLRLRTEIHASHFITKSPPVPGMNRNTRLSILRNLLDELATMDFISVTNVIVSKAGKPPDYDVFGHAWRALFQRFENTLLSGHFPGAYRLGHGLVLTDSTDGGKLKRLMRRMGAYNPIPNQGWAGPGSRNLPISKIIEDPHPKDSRDSHFIQACDACAYFLMQSVRPNSFIRRAGAQHYLRRLRPILNLWASHTDPLGVVRL